MHGSGVERGGTDPHWRSVIVAICFNMDVGEGWEFADDGHVGSTGDHVAGRVRISFLFGEASYEALRLGLNYGVYAMTH